MKKLILLFICTSLFAEEYRYVFPYYNLGDRTFEEFKEARNKYGRCWDFKMFGKALVWLPCHFECDQNKTKCNKKLSYKGKRLQNLDIELLSKAIGEHKCKTKNNITKEESRMLLDQYCWIIMAGQEHIRESKLYKATYDKVKELEKNPFHFSNHKKTPFAK